MSYCFAICGAEPRKAKATGQVGIFFENKRSIYYINLDFTQYIAVDLFCKFCAGANNYRICRQNKSEAMLFATVARERCGSRATVANDSGKQCDQMNCF